jgi:vancomycin resistance protein VanJ
MNPQAVSTQSRARRWGSGVVAVLCWGYLLILVCSVVALRRWSDREWRVTLLAFAPRGAALVPLALLILLAIWVNRKMLIVLAFSAVVAIFPLMGFCLSYRHFKPVIAQGVPMRVLGFNCHSDYLRGPEFPKYLAAVHPDVVAIEELPSDYDHHVFPRSVWNLVEHDELFLASRYPIIAAHDLWRNAMTKFTLQTPGGMVDVVVVHLSSPHYALRDAVTGHEQGESEMVRNIRNRATEAGELQKLAAASTNRPLIVVGDFNLVPDSTLLAGRFPTMNDCFEATGLGFGWTYFNGWTVVRIDRLLSNPFFSPLDFAVGPRFKSPHRPIVADLILQRP